MNPEPPGRIFCIAITGRTSSTTANRASTWITVAPSVTSVAFRGKRFCSFHGADWASISMAAW